MMTSPSNDSMSDRRRYPRLEAPLYARPARLRRVDKQQVLDASLGGIRIYSDDYYPEQKPLELDLFLRDGSSVQCVARVAWTKKLDPSAPALYEVGLAFTDVKPEVLELLKTVLAKDEGGPEA